MYVSAFCDQITLTKNNKSVGTRGKQPKEILIHGPMEGKLGYYTRTDIQVEVISFE